MIELERFFDLASDLMCVLDAEGRCCQINAAFTTVLGYGNALIQTQRLADLAHVDDRAAHQAEIDRLLTGGQTVASFAGRYRHRAGHWLRLTWRLSAVDGAIAIRAADAAESSSTPKGRGVERWLYCVAQHDDLSHINREHNGDRDGRDHNGHLQLQIPNEDRIYQLNQVLEEQVAERTEQLATAQDRYQALLKTERQAHRQAAASKAEAQLYANAVHNMQVGLYIWCLEAVDRASSLRLIAANPAASESSGVMAEDILGKTILEAFPAITDTDIAHTYAEVVRTGQNAELGEVLYEDDRVEKSIFSVKAFPLPDQCVGVAFENITQRKQEDDIRHDQDKQLRIIFDQAAVGMARLDPDGYWIQVNQKLCDMLGYTMPALLTQTFAAVTHPDDAALEVTSDQRLISGELPQISFEKRCLTQSGEVVWTYVTASTVHDAQGNLLYFIVTVQDITERKQANLALQSKTEDLMRLNRMLTNALEALEQRNQELDQFAYVTSHDLKAPLRAIANLATWIEEDLGDRLPNENREQFELLKNRVHRMEGLINGLLEYSRIGRTRQPTEIVDVGVLMTEITDSLSPLGEFTVETAPEMPVFRTKRVLLSQVLSNLVNNAIKHHDRSDGRVQVSARDLGDFYEFTVADDGPGIDPAYHRKVFTIFQTLRPRDDLESTGIGLSLVKKTVAAEGGRIMLQSEAGQGAIFRFTWPKEPRSHR